MVGMQISISHELEHLNLPDQRLNRRAQLIAESIDKGVNESLPTACPDWSELIGAYRFFGNERVNTEDLRKPHVDRTIERTKGCAIVRCIEDTTVFDFGRHQSTQGLGPITKDYQHGFLSHMMIACDGRDRCLGLLRQESWARTEGLGKRAQRKSKPIEDKESFRWLEGYRRVEELAQRYPDRQWVYVADREADIYELYYESKDAHYVIRSRTDRNAVEGGTMLAKVSECESLGQWEIDAPARLKRAGRKITVSAKAHRLLLNAPWRPSSQRFTHPSEATVVLVEEVDPPENTEPVCWVLLTSLPVENVEQAREVVGHYQCRWQIEIFFRTLKSGCNYEKLQLQSFDKLRLALVIYSLIAWRIVALTQAAKVKPDASCEEVLVTEEWHAIHMLQGKPLTKQAPKIGEAVIELARLGGYLNRKNDPPPGPTAIWRGLRLISPVVLLLKEGKIKCV